MAEPTRSGDESGVERRWGTAESWLIGIGTGLVVVALMGATYTIGYNRGKDHATGSAARPAGSEPSAGPSPAATEPGKQLFAQTCGSCHTLSDAETTGTVGPDLDVLAPDAATVESAIQVGGSETGAMPADLYNGKEAEQVAAYVAAVAGE